MEEEGGRHAQAQRRRRPRSPAASASSSSPPPSKRACLAASYEAMLGLRHIMPSDLTAGGEADDDCAICLTSLLVHPDPEDIKITAMPCSHAFHQRCISQWLSRNATCPLCRHALRPMMTVHGRMFLTLDEEDRYFASLGDAMIHLQDDTEEEEEVDEETEAMNRESRAFVQRLIPPTPRTIVIDPRTGIQMSAE